MGLATREFINGSSSSDRTNSNLNTGIDNESNFEDHGTLGDSYEDESTDGTKDNRPLLGNTRKVAVNSGRRVINVFGMNI